MVYNLKVEAAFHHGQKEVEKKENRTSSKSKWGLKKYSLKKEGEREEERAKGGGEWGKGSGRNNGGKHNQEAADRTGKQQVELASSAALGMQLVAAAAAVNTTGVRELTSTNLQ